MQVLELGCGNSQMCEDLYKDGVTNITCIDLSSVAVENMQKRLFSRGFKGEFVVQLEHYKNPFFNSRKSIYISK